jgi:beta-phosphoglucomutase
MDNGLMKQLAVIFDVDGVLVDSYEAHFKSWRELFHELSIDYGEKEFAASFGRTSREILREKFGDELPDTRLRELDERKEHLYRAAFRECFVPMPGATELVHVLAADGFLLGVGSSGPRANVELALELLQLDAEFRVKVTGADVTRGKPDPQVFELAAERLGVPTSACAVLEDAVHGISAANRAGMVSVAIVGTATREELAHAHFVVDELCAVTPERIRQLIETGGKRTVD